MVVFTFLKFMQPINAIFLYRDLKGGLAQYEYFVPKMYCALVVVAVVITVFSALLLLSIACASRADEADWINVSGELFCYK